MNENLFETATRQKLRFPSVKGELSIEQLWDVPLRGDFSLDSIAKAASKNFKAASEESFVVETTKTAAYKRLEQTLETVKYIITTKLAEEDAEKRRSANKDEKAKLLAILSEKQDGKLSSLSEAELKKRIAALSE